MQHVPRFPMHQKAASLSYVFMVSSLLPNYASFRLFFSKMIFLPTNHTCMERLVDISSTP
jgi:hypothetical protein